MNNNKFKIKTVAVALQNNIQYESFKVAIDIMIKRKINVDIYIPYGAHNGNDNMFDDFYKLIKKKNYNVLREIESDKIYDIFFAPYYINNLDSIKRKYTIKYMYGLSTKPDSAFSSHVNYIFDAFLCYGEYDASYLNYFGKTFEIGNIKFFETKYKNNSTKRPNKKLNLLYLPTHAGYSSVEVLSAEIFKLSKKYNISIKPHHCTQYKKVEEEMNRMKIIKKYFKKIYNSNDSFEKLLNEADVVITDNSGAVFDTICLKKPVLMYYNKKQNDKDMVSLPIQFAQKGYIAYINEPKNLEEKLNQALSPQQIEKNKKAFKMLYHCENNKSAERFIEFLDTLENGFIDEKHYKLHKYEEKEINDLKQQINELKNQLNRTKKQFKEFKNKIYNSASWKITKPLRKIRKIIK